VSDLAKGDLVRVTGGLYVFVEKDDLAIVVTPNSSTGSRRSGLVEIIHKEGRTDWVWHNVLEKIDD